MLRYPEMIAFYDHKTWARFGVIELVPLVSHTNKALFSSDKPTHHFLEKPLTIVFVNVMSVVIK